MTVFIKRFYKRKFLPILFMFNQLSKLLSHLLLKYTTEESVAAV